MKVKLVATLFLLFLVMVFAVQNAEVVQLKFLIWELSFPRSLLIFMMLLIGIIVGWFGCAMVRVRRAAS